jgi:hypothetical protein
MSSLSMQSLVILPLCVDLKNDHSTPQVYFQFIQFILLSYVVVETFTIFHFTFDLFLTILTPSLSTIICCFSFE